MWESDANGCTCTCTCVCSLSHHVWCSVTLNGRVSEHLLTSTPGGCFHTHTVVCQRSGVVATCAPSHAPYHHMCCVRPYLSMRSLLWSLCQLTRLGPLSCVHFSLLPWVTVFCGALVQALKRVMNCGRIPESLLVREVGVLYSCRTGVALGS